MGASKRTIGRGWLKGMGTIAYRKAIKQTLIIGAVQDDLENAKEKKLLPNEISAAQKRLDNLLQGFESVVLKQAHAQVGNSSAKGLSQLLQHSVAPSELGEEHPGTLA